MDFGFFLVTISTTFPCQRSDKSSRGLRFIIWTERTLSKREFRINGLYLRLLYHRTSWRDNESHIRKGIFLSNFFLVGRKSKNAGTSSLQLHGEKGPSTNLGDDDDDEEESDDESDDELGDDEIELPRKTSESKV